MATANASQTSVPTQTASSLSVTILTGAVQPTSALLSATTVANVTTGTNATITTTSSAQPSNTQPCNNYPELCTRKYSNITEVGAHNSPFVRPGNAASNQELGVIAQLNDGIRMCTPIPPTIPPQGRLTIPHNTVQGQTHMENNTLYYCHTSCALLNAGPVESYLRDVTSWIRTHPYDVVTILIGNGDFVDVGNYTRPIENSGLSKYAYIPPKTSLSAADWPTLSELILTGKRAVIFMDYKANQTAVPYVLDEFSHMWETPFSPTDRAFPCTVDRPPGINDSVAGEMLYVANHNLNVEIKFAGNSILVPNTVLLNETNNVTGFGSLGLMANHCAGKSSSPPCPFPFPFPSSSSINQPPHIPSQQRCHTLTDEHNRAAAWPRPPTFLLVDDYNVDNGAVFEVAAQQNNVSYTRPCCGLVPSAASESWDSSGRLRLVWWVVLVLGVLVFW